MHMGMPIEDQSTLGYSQTDGREEPAGKGE